MSPIIKMVGFIVAWNWVASFLTTMSDSRLRGLTISVCRVECLHLVLSHAGETCNTSTASPAVTRNKQYLFILLLIEWSICILPLVGETHNTSTVASTVTHWKWNKQCLLLLLSGVSALSIIAACWRDMQHKHYIYCDLLKVEQTVLVITIEWIGCTYNCRMLERHALHLLLLPLKTQIDDIRWSSPSIL